MKPWLIFFIIILFVSCEEEVNQPPTCNISSPSNNQSYSMGDEIRVVVNAEDPDGSVAAVKLYLNEVGVTSMESPPFEYYINTWDFSPNNYTLKATARDDEDELTITQISITVRAGLPSVSTDSVISVTKNSANAVGNVLSDGGIIVSERGFCWNTLPNPTTTNDHVTAGTGSGVFIASLTDLQCNTPYYVRAYAVNSLGTNYGSQLTFTTSECSLDPPTVTTLMATSVSVNTATVHGDVTSDGGSEVTDRGVYVSSSSDPVITGTKTSIGAGTGLFSWILSGLTGSTKYYFAAYASNASGTSYGDVISFTTSTPPGYPAVGTAAVNNVTTNSAMSGGNVTDDGGETISTRGVCWSTTSNPTISDAFTSDGTGTGNFTSSISGLNSGITYYVRAYASNATGTGYGDELTFVTPAPAGLPAVSSSAVTNVTETSAQSGGNVSDDGGETVTSRGVCWSTSPNPTIGDAASDDGTGTGGFVSEMTGLDPGTDYYVRAYATNSQGTAYGAEVSFTTDASTVDISFTSSPPLSSELGTLYTYDAEVNYSGTVPTFALDDGPTGMTVNSSTGVVSWTSAAVGDYPVSLSATNNTGTLTQKWTISVYTNNITDYDGNVYTSVLIGSQTWMVENLKTTHYSDGTPIPLVEDDGVWNALTDPSKAYCWYGNNPANGDEYGAIYTWAAVMNDAASSDSDPSGVQGVCPSGWHVPSDEEWKQLLMGLGMSRAAADTEDYIGSDEGGMLKETGLSHWISPNSGATNSSGFTGLPGGIRDSDGSFYSLGYLAVFWTATENGALARNLNLEYDKNQVKRGNYYKDSGASVRCIKNN